jgi:hypothetical protein
VAEKMAALSVVEERLRKIGLGPFCLELHSNKAQKAAVLAQLKETTEVARQQSPEQFAREAKRLYEARNQLNAYVQALHRKQSFGLSLYEAVPRYLKTDCERVRFLTHHLEGPPQALVDGVTLCNFVDIGQVCDIRTRIRWKLGSPIIRPRPNAAETAWPMAEAVAAAHHSCAHHQNHRLPPLPTHHGKHGPAQRLFALCGRCILHAIGFAFPLDARSFCCNGKLSAQCSPPLLGQRKIRKQFSNTSHRPGSKRPAKFLPA